MIVKAATAAKKIFTVRGSGDTLSPEMKCEEEISESEEEVEAGMLECVPVMGSTMEMVVFQGELTQDAVVAERALAAGDSLTETEEVAREGDVGIGIEPMLPFAQVDEVAPPPKKPRHLDRRTKEGKAHALQLVQAATADDVDDVCKGASSLPERGNTMKTMIVKAATAAKKLFSVRGTGDTLSPEMKSFL